MEDRWSGRTARQGLRAPQWRLMAQQPLVMAVDGSAATRDGGCPLGCGLFVWGAHKAVDPSAMVDR